MEISWIIVVILPALLAALVVHHSSLHSDFFNHAYFFQ
jgi:hypothetical protein